MYHCNECGELIDGDYNVCSEDPRPGNENELVCEGCITEMAEPPSPITFTARQEAIIAAAERQEDIENDYYEK